MKTSNAPTPAWPFPSQADQEARWIFSEEFQSFRRLVQSHIDAAQDAAASGQAAGTAGKGGHS